MWTTLTATVSKAVGDVTKSVFDFLSKKKEKQTETELIKDKHRYQEGVDIAEQMWKIAFKNIDRFEERDREKFLKLHDDFLEKN